MSVFYIRSFEDRSKNTLCDPSHTAEPGNVLVLREVLSHPWKWNGHQQIVHAYHSNVSLGVGPKGLPILRETRLEPRSRWRYDPESKRLILLAEDGADSNQILRVIAKQGALFRKKVVIATWKLVFLTMDSSRFGRIWRTDNLSASMDETEEATEHEESARTSRFPAGQLDIIHFASCRKLDARLNGVVMLTDQSEEKWVWQENGQITRSGHDNFCIGFDMNSSSKFAYLVDKNNCDGLKTR